MRFDSQKWLDQLKTVEREYLAASYATHNLLSRGYADTGLLPKDIRVSDLERATDNLEGTYIVRMFSEFETGLRQHWSVSRTKEPPSRAKDLVEGTAAYRRIPTDREASVHAVRRYRNVLVHERDDELLPISLCLTRRYLCVFLSFLR